MIPLLAAISAVGNAASSVVAQLSHLGGTGSAGGKTASAPASGSFADVLAAQGVGGTQADPAVRPVG